jgi:endo-1,3-1,4-beta-glycanase ExoK
MFQKLFPNVKLALLLALTVLAIGVNEKRVAAQVPAGFGATPIFDEEFNGTSLDPATWTYRGAGTVKHLCQIDPSAVTVRDGHARISIYGGKNQQGIETNFCGAIATQSGTFLHRYGYWEVSARYHYQPGLHCGFWVDSPQINSPLVNDPQGSGTEMDVFERIESADDISYDHAVWWNGYGPYATGIAHEGKQSNLDDGNFHTFGLAWTPGGMTFYIDGVKTWHLSASEAAVSNIPEYIILDTEVSSGGNIPVGGYGPLGSSTSPYMDVDYVRVYPYSTKTTSTTLIPIAEAYVQDGNAAKDNFFGSRTLSVKSAEGGDNQKTYLKFDLSKLTGTILQATIYLTPVRVGESKADEVANYLPNSKSINIANYVPNNGWSAGEMTWNNQPDASVRLSSGTIYGAGLLTNFDVTAVAKAGKQLSVQIAPDPSSSGQVPVAYGSSRNETVSYRPRLVVITGQSQTRR